MHNPDTQCTVRGERMPNGREDFLFKYLLSCHKNMTFISQSYSMETGAGTGIHRWIHGTCSRTQPQVHASAIVRVPSRVIRAI